MVRAVGPGKFVVAVVVLRGLDRSAQSVDGIFGGILAGGIQRRTLWRVGNLPHGTLTLAEQRNDERRCYLDEQELESERRIQTLGDATNRLKRELPS